MRRKIVARIGTGFRKVRVMILDIASPRRGEIIKFVPSVVTSKAVVFVGAMETGGKGVDQLAVLDDAELKKSLLLSLIHI